MKFNLNAPDFAGRGRQALAANFCAMVQDIREQWQQKADAAPRDVAPPEPMLEAMGKLTG